MNWTGEEWLPGDSPYGRLPTDPDAGELLDEDDLYSDYHADEPFADDPRVTEDSPPTMQRAAQDAIIDRLNIVLDRDDWDGAAEMAYEALTIDPTYDRAINALLRCYLHCDTLREMHHVLLKLFDPEGDRPHQKHRVLAYSYRVMSQARLWDEWEPFETLSELADVQDALKEGLSKLNATYGVGEEGAYEKRRVCAGAGQLSRRASRCVPVVAGTALCYYGFFEESAAALAALRVSGSGNADVQRLWAEVTWWRNNGKWLPWIH